MIGLASRAGKYPSGKAVVMTHVSKKAYLNKFLFEPLPIESTLHDNLGDALNAAIVSRTVNSMQDAVEWLTWFYFYRRLPQNPNYYSLAGISDEQMSEFVSVLTENTVDELVKAGLVEQHEDGSLSSLNLGILSTHLYINYQTTELFALSITAKTKRRGLLQILSSATEFEDVLVRTPCDVDPPAPARAAAALPHGEAPVLRGGEGLALRQKGEHPPAGLLLERGRQQRHADGHTKTAAYGVAIASRWNEWIE